MPSNSGWGGLVEACNIAVEIARLGLNDTMKVSYSYDDEYTNSGDIVATKKPSIMDIDSDVAD